MVACRKRSLEYIADESKRRATFKKRKLNVFKKASELSTLCGVESCVIVYTPDEIQPEVWPSPHEANDILAKFNSMSDEKKRTKMTDSERLLRRPIEKMKQELQKIEMENRELELKLMLNQCLAGRCDMRNLGPDDVAGLRRMVDMELKKVQGRIDGIGGSSESCLVTDSGDGDVAEGPTCMQLFPMSSIREQEEKKNG